MNKLSIVILLIAPLLFSCSKKSIIRNYYLIEVPQNINVEKVKPEKQFAANVDVRDFQVAKAFEQTRIALRTKTNELNYYYYHHWAVRPSYSLADQIFLILDKRGLFNRCIRGFSYNPDYLIWGTVESIERLHLDNKQIAHLSMTLQLVDAETETPVVRHYFNKSVELKNKKNMNAFAQTISQILFEEGELFSEKISEYLQAAVE